MKENNREDEDLPPLFICLLSVCEQYNSKKLLSDFNDIWIVHCTTFRQRLKTFLFQASFPDIITDTQ